jgi:hypothetical protein
MDQQVPAGNGLQASRSTVERRNKGRFPAGGFHIAAESDSGLPIVNSADTSQ